MYESILFFTSNGRGSTIDADYSGFTINLTGTQTIQIPATSKVCYASLMNLNFWNNFLNIADSLGNNRFYYSTNVGFDSNSVWPYITIPNGNYSLTDLQNNIRIQLTPIIAGFTDTDLTFTPEYSTNKVLITTKKVRLFFGSSSPYFLMGYNLNDIVNINTLPVSAPKIAQFGESFAIQVHSSLAQSSYNGQLSDVLNMIGITARPGSNQYTEIANPIRCDAFNLIGARINSIYISITNQDGKRFLSTDAFSLAIKLEWE